MFDHAMSGYDSSDPYVSLKNKNVIGEKNMLSSW